MDCTEARMHLLDRRRGTLGREIRARVDAHLEGCEACRREDAADRELSIALDERLPKRRAPDGLRRAIEAQLAPAGAPRELPRPKRRAPAIVIALAAGAIAAAAAAWALKPSGWAGSGSEPMVAEAVNDHLRVLYSENPIEIASGGVHQVKPWFEGRVDFAPAVAFGGDEDFPLQGGAIAYFVDRKAAAYVYKRRLHLITLFVYRADGLPWPAPTLPLGHVRAAERSSRGFHALIWRDGDLGYSLVSDLDPQELRTLAGKIAGP